MQKTLEKHKGNRTVSDDFWALTEAFGRKNVISEASKKEISTGYVPISGKLSAQSLESGIQFSRVDLTSRSAFEFSTFYPRSLCFLVAIEGYTSDMKGKVGQSYMLKAGEVFAATFSDETKIFGSIHENQYVKSVLIQLREDVVRDSSLQELISTETKNTQVKMLGSQLCIAQLARALFNSESCGVVGKMMLESQTHEIIAESSKLINGNLHGNVSQSDRLKMNIVKEKLYAHPEMDHTLLNLAQEVGLSPSSLKTKFREVYGKPVFKYLHDIRMEHARNGIIQNGWSIKQAAFFAGYKHPENFSTAFHKKFDISPSKYRR